MSQKNNQPNVSEEATEGEVSLSDMMRQMAQQNSQLLILLEHFTGNQQEAPLQRSDPEKNLESLASNVKEFHFDPENGLTFDRWFSKYEDLFRQDGRDLDDAAKVRLLLRSLSVPVHENFLNYLLPSHPRDFNFDDVVDKLKQISGQQKSLFSKRYDCLKLEKNETDDFVSYVGIVNRQCEDFELQKLTVNQFKSLIFICGLKSAKDADVRTPLLAKLESDQVDTINLECGKIGHKEGYCGHCGCFATPSSSKSVGDKKKKKSCSTKVIQTVQQVNSRRKYISVIFNKTVAKLQLDCGSDITVISHTTWKTIGSPSFSTTSVEASTASGEPLELVGEFISPITIGHVTKTTICYITSVENLNVIGLDWMDAFDLWSKPLAAYCKQVNQSNLLPLSEKHFFTQYTEVFQDSLGHCTKTKISLTLKQDVQPVPFHAIQKVDEELDRLQRLNIISPVDFSDWAAPIVVVKKPGGKVRLCADYSTGLNAALETNNFPLPTPEEIFSKVSGSKIFSIIDLSDAYLQVEVDDKSKKLLTIMVSWFTHRGLFHFNRLARGVKSAPGIFQQLKSKMVSGIRGVKCFSTIFWCIARH
ncbi:uncharacterized protein K02A2.6-like [Armigeres subalbatus]|uniref:uncharacterized protein K02A2.6-like n=1 Tax=Armigeres subalbatus TaxID=124917 RepID=UPI002ED493A1